MRKRFLNAAIALGMVIGLLAGVMGSASAATPGTSQNGADQNWIFFPWVPNGEQVGGTGPWYGSVTIQNVESVPVDITFGQTAGGLDNVSQTTTLPAHAYMTFSAADLFGADASLANKGSGVAVTASWNPNNLPTGDAQPCDTNRVDTLHVTRSVATEFTSGGVTIIKTADQDVVPLDNTNETLGNTIFGIGGGGPVYNEGSDYTVTYATSDSGQYYAIINWNPSSAISRPVPGFTYGIKVYELNCVRAPVIAGVEKQAAPQADASFSVNTTSDNMIVDGYTGVSDADVAWGPNSKACTTIAGGQCNNLGQYYLGMPIGDFFGSGSTFGFDGTSYLPIVQANWSGWNTIINLTNIDASSGDYGSVTVRFFNQGTGTGAQAAAVWQGHIAQGGTAQIDLSAFMASKGISNFLGSAWITSSYGVVASAMRVKPKNNMAMINTSAPSILSTTSPSNGADYINAGTNGEFTMYAPLVFKDYNGWNTGINIVNTSEFTNQVTIQIVSRDGTTIGSYSVTMYPKAMQYVYLPTTQELGLGNGDFGAATLTGSAPFYATVDEVKYSTGDAMSYMATGATINNTPSWCQWPENSQHRTRYPFACSHGNELALALFQNGYNSNGVEHGDTSGINIYNPGSDVANGYVTFYTADGSLEAPSTTGTVPFSVGSMGSTLVYAPNMSTMTAGIQLSAVVTATSGQIVAVSNNVNYDVNGDGAAVFNLANQFGSYRYVCSQQQCGIQAFLGGNGGQGGGV